MYKTIPCYSFHDLQILKIPIWHFHIYLFVRVNAERVHFIKIHFSTINPALRLKFKIFIPIFTTRTRISIFVIIAAATILKLSHFFHKKLLTITIHCFQGSHIKTQIPIRMGEVTQTL